MNGAVARTVLVVDDDADHRAIIRAVLTLIAPEARVELCADAASFLVALGRAPERALVLIDRRLGAAESFEVIAEAHTRRADAAIVMLSAALAPAARAAALRAGARDAIEKPSSLAGWRSVLGGLLGATGTPAGQRAAA